MNRLQFGFIALTFLVGCERRPAAAPIPSATAQAGTVTVEIDMDGKVDVVEITDVAEGTTLEALMKLVKQPPVKMRGSETTAFVESIGERETTGSDGWTFLVDGEFSQQGVGTTILSPPTTITWKYGDFSDQQP